MSREAAQQRQIDRHVSWMHKAERAAADMLSGDPERVTAGRAWWRAHFNQPRVVLSAQPLPDTLTQPSAEDRKAMLADYVTGEPYPNPGPDGWIAWAGGRCPVEPGTPIQILFRGSTPKDGDAKELDICRRPEDLRWRHVEPAGQQFGGDIAFYRLAAEGSTRAKPDHGSDAGAEPSCGEPHHPSNPLVETGLGEEL